MTPFGGRDTFSSACIRRTARYPTATSSHDKYNHVRRANLLESRYFSRSREIFDNPRRRFTPDEERTLFRASEIDSRFAWLSNDRYRVHVFVVFAVSLINCHQLGRESCERAAYARGLIIERLLDLHQRGCTLRNETR